MREGEPIGLTEDQVQRAELVARQFFKNMRQYVPMRPGIPNPNSPGGHILTSGELADMGGSLVAACLDALTDFDFPEAVSKMVDSRMSKMEESGLLKGADGKPLTTEGIKEMRLQLKRECWKTIFRAAKEGKEPTLSGK